MQTLSLPCSCMSGSIALIWDSFKVRRAFRIQQLKWLVRAAINVSGDRLRRSSEQSSIFKTVLASPV